MYSIKTDLDVLGNSTLEKELLVKGNAVFQKDLTVQGTVTFADATFTQITVTDTATVKDIESTGIATLNTVNASGDVTLGTDATNTLTVNSTPEFKEAATFDKDITQVSGQTTLQNTDVQNLTVNGTSTFVGDMTAAAATFDSIDTDTVVATSVTSTDIDSSGTATFNDVVINGTLGGTYTVANGQFDNLTVTQMSTLQNLTVKGSTTLTGNITGSNSTALFKTVTINGVDGIIQFNYQNPAKPTDIVSAIEPYKISSHEFTGDISTIDRGTFGDVTFTDPSLIVDGIGQIDYLDITGNTTTGTTRPQFTVAGNATFGGMTTVKDLTITGAVSGLSFTDLTVSGNETVGGTLDVTGDATFNNVTVNGTLDATIDSGVFNTLEVTGNSTLNSVVMSGNLTGTNSTATLNHVSVAGSDGIIDFAYNDPARATDTKSAVEPYKVSSHEFNGDISTIDRGTFGDVTFTDNGLTVAGFAEIDYLTLTGNTTTGTTKPQLLVGGKTQVNDLQIDGTISGNFSIDLTGKDVNSKSLTTTDQVAVGTNLTVGGTSTLTGNTSIAGTLDVTGQTTTVVDLVVTGTTSGVVADVDGEDILPNSVVADAGIIGASLESTAATTVGTELTVGTNLTVGGDAHLGGTSGTTTVQNLVVNGTTTGITADVAGADITPKSVTATAAIKGATLESTTTAKVGTDLTVGGTLGVTGATTLGATTVGDLTLTGSITGLDLTGQDITVNSLTSTTSVAADTISTTNNATIGGDLDVIGTLTAGTIDLGTGTLTVGGLHSTGDVTIDTNLTVSGTVQGTLQVTNLTTSGTATLDSVTVTNASTLDSVAATSLTVSGVSSLDGGITSSGTNIALQKDTQVTGDLGVSGTLTAGGIDLSGADISAKTLSTTGNVDVGGNLTVAGTFDLSATDLSANSVTSATTLESTTSTTVGTELILTAGTITGDALISGDSTVGGTFGVTGISSLNGGITSSTTRIELLKDTHVTGTLTADTIDLGTGVLNVGGVVSSGDISTATKLTVGTTLGVTGASSLHATTVTGTLNVTGQSTLAAVVINNTLSAAGKTTLVDVSMADADADTILIGTGTPTDPKYISNTFGHAYVGGDLDVTGTINANINLSGRDIAPRSVTTSGDIISGGDITAAQSVNGALGEFGTDTGAYVALNLMQVHGTMTIDGDLNVPYGKINGTLDQSSSDVEVKSLHSLSTVDVDTILTVTGASNLTTLGTSGLATLNSASVTTTLKVTGATTLSTVTTSGLATLASASVTGALDVGGVLTAKGNTVIGTSATNTLVVNATPEFKENTTFDKDVTITGSLNVDSFAPDSIDTKKYTVTPAAKQTASTASVSGMWTPDGTSNVYWLDVDQQVKIGAVTGLIGGGQSTSIFIYVKQNSTGGFSVNFDSMYGVIGGDINTSPDSVSIIQLIYDGYSTTIDAFVAQRV